MFIQFFINQLNLTEMQKLETKNPVLPNGGTKPVVVNTTSTLDGMFISSAINNVIFLHEGTLFGGEEIKPGVLHGGEAIEPGVLHGGEEIKPGVLHGGEEIKPGVLHLAEYAPATYRTKDGTGEYKYRFVEKGGKFDIDILSQPSYAGRNDSSVASHRLMSPRGGKKICFGAGKEPRDIKTARAVCVEFSELTHNYIKTGKSIDSQVKDNNSSVKKIWKSITN